MQLIEVWKYFHGEKSNKNQQKLRVCSWYYRDEAFDLCVCSQVEGKNIEYN